MRCWGGPGVVSGPSAAGATLALAAPRLGEHRLHQLVLGLLDLLAQERPQLVRVDACELGQLLEPGRLVRQAAAHREHEGWRLPGRPVIDSVALAARYSREGGYHQTG